MYSTVISKLRTGSDAHLAKVGQDHLNFGFRRELVMHAWLQ